MPTDPDATIETWTTPDGSEFVIALDESETGTEAPFYAVYHDTQQSHLYGWFCAHCETIETVMGPMRAIECTDCPNESQPTQWDAAYL